MNKSRLIGAACAAAFSFITLPSHAVTVTDATNLGADIQNFGVEAAYLFVDATRTFTEWEAYAQTLGSDWHLVSIHSLAENNYVWSLGGGSNLGLGLIDQTSPFDFGGLGATPAQAAAAGVVWSDGSAVDYLAWNPSDGPQANSENMAFMFNTSLWADIDENNPTSGAVLKATITSAVPVPAAVWLFGSGLLGLVGIARRKAA